MELCRTGRYHKRSLIEEPAGWRRAGYRMSGELPDLLRTGPTILRTYRADGTLLHERITMAAKIDLAQPIRRLLDEVATVTVHVRAVR